MKSSRVATCPENVSRSTCAAHQGPRVRLGHVLRVDPSRRAAAAADRLQRRPGRLYRLLGPAAATYSVPYFPNVTMGWDSSPRADQADELGNSGYPFMNTVSGNTPERFREALEIAHNRLLARTNGPRILNDQLLERVDRGKLRRAGHGARDEVSGSHPPSLRREPAVRREYVRRCERPSWELGQAFSFPSALLANEQSTAAIRARGQNVWPLAIGPLTDGLLLLGRSRSGRAGGRRIVTGLLHFLLVGDCRRASGAADLFLFRDRGRVAAAHKSQRQSQKAGASQRGDELLHGLPLCCRVQRPVPSLESHARSPTVGINRKYRTRVSELSRFAIRGTERASIRSRNTSGDASTMSSLALTAFPRGGGSPSRPTAVTVPHAPGDRRLHRERSR